MTTPKSTTSFPAELITQPGAGATEPIQPAETPTTGPEAIAHALTRIDLDKVRQEAMADIRSGKKTHRPDAIKKIGYLEGFRRSGLHPGDLVLHSVPVIPPKFRPFSIAGDTFIPGDANELYRDLINVRDSHGELEQALGPEGAASNRLHVYDAVKAVYGYGDPVSPKTKERGVSGFLRKLVGAGSPKGSFVQAKMLGKNQDYVGRGVITVNPDLGMDEIGIPDEMAWKLYAPYIQRRLVRGGMHASDAVKLIRDRDARAETHLEAEMKERPVLYSRSPSWHKFNVIGGWPSRISGSAISINPFVGTGLSSDHDGDTVNLHLVSLPESVQDVKEKLMPSRMLFSTKNPDTLVPTPKQENILGLWTAQRRPAKQTHNFASEAEALKAIRQGKVSLSDEINLPGEKS